MNFFFSCYAKNMCRTHSVSSSSKLIFYFFIFFFVLRCGMSSSIAVDVFSMRPLMKCFNDDLIPVFKMTWDESRVEVNQVLEDDSITKYLLQSQASHLRTNTVVCMSRRNLSSFSFSFTSNLLDQPVEFDLDHMPGDTKGLFSSPKFAKKLSFWIRKIINNQPVFEKSEIPFLQWNFFFQYTTQDVTFMNGTFSTNCVPFETNTKPLCFYKSAMNLQTHHLSWAANGKIRRSPDSAILSVRIAGNASHQPTGPLIINASWNTTQKTSVLFGELVLGIQSLLSLTINSSSINGLQLSIELVSLAFDWRFFSNWNILPKADGRAVTAIAEGNYLLQPSAIPITYHFGLLESNSSSRVFVLHHNISSALYRFEGNMTVDLEPMDSEQEIVTNITQKIRTSSLERPLWLDLQQIFHQSGHWTWETVVLRSGLFDMHVSGHWNHTIFHRYRKIFQIHSHDENCLPSMNLEVNYSNRLRFYHQVSYPLLACSYCLLVRFSDPSSFIPAEVKILYRDEFKTNHSRSILQLKLSEINSILTAKAFIEWLDMNRVIVSIENQLEKLTVWMADEQHPINQLLKPIVRRPTLANGFADTLKWLRNYS